MVRPSQQKTGLVSVVSQFLEAHQNYDAAKANAYQRRRTGIPLGGAHADYHYRSDADYLRMMEYARDLDRNDVAIGELLTRATDVTMLHGIDALPETSNKDFNKGMADEWWAWAQDREACDAQGEQDFYQKQRGVFRQSLGDGDIEVLLLDNGTMFDVEAHRVRTPKRTERNVVHGVMLDGQRKRVEYWVTKEDLDINAPLKLVSDVHRYPTRDEHGHRQVLQVYDAKRVSQTRGVSPLVPIFDTASFLGDINFAALVQQQITACTTVLRQRGPNWQPNGMPTGTTETEEVEADNGSLRTIRRSTVGLSPGAEIASDPDETIELASPSVPSPQYFAHVKMTLQLMSMNLGVPLCIFLMDATETNFSGFRGSVDIAKFGWQRNQARICTQYVSPVYLWRLRSTLLRSTALRKMAAAMDPRDLRKHRCVMPKWPYIQPLQDATTGALRVSSHQTSLQRLHGESNSDAFDVLDETTTFNQKAITQAIEKAEEINRQFPNLKTPVSWRDVWQPAPPTGVNISMSVDPQPEKPAAQPPAGDDNRAS